jgi:hypothetical protein
LCAPYPSLLTLSRLTLISSTRRRSTSFVPYLVRSLSLITYCPSTQTSPFLRCSSRGASSAPLSLTPLRAGRRGGKAHTGQGCEDPSLAEAHEDQPAAHHLRFLCTFTPQLCCRPPPNVLTSCCVVSRKQDQWYGWQDLLFANEGGLMTMTGDNPATLWPSTGKPGRERLAGSMQP